MNFKDMKNARYNDKNKYSCIFHWFFFDVVTN